MIHPTAIVSKKAKLGPDVSVGPYSVIGDNVTIGKGTLIGSHSVVEGNTTIGEKCEIFTGAVVGSRPQDMKYKGDKVFLEIGNANIIREYCTLNPGTNEGDKTVIGNNNLLMAYSHIAHDCCIGNNCVIANNGTCAGYVTIEDKAVIGGIVAIHQFVRIGTLSIIGGCSKVVQDIPPYSTCDGHPAAVYGLNLVGLRRNNIPKESIRELHQAFKILFNEGLSPKHALTELMKQVKQTKEVAYLVDFINNSKRGLAHSCRTK
jgi:UDP-N-acetylglucosamine acyltransferase